MAAKVVVTIETANIETEGAKREVPKE